MKKKARYSLIIVVVLVVILGLGFGIWKIFFAPRPLKIKDLENAHITTTRSSEEYGWTYLLLNYTGSVPFNEEGEGQYDNQNIFRDGKSSEEALALRIYIARMRAEQITVPVGDSIKITYDGGQKLIIYLPEMHGDTELYVASDGSTYYDRRLTKLAQKAPTSEEGR